jgi:1-acyl-sn-glycerol-3-phosphate acyltransferase
MINLIRTVTFYLASMCLLICSIIFFLFFIFKRSWFIKFCHVNLTALIYICKYTCGIGWKIEGKENIPNEPFVLACKHLSAWETFFFASYFKIPVYIFKQELLRLPILGLYMKYSGMLPIKRGEKGKMILNMTNNSVDVIKNQKRILVIFPQGTRTPISSQTEDELNTKKFPYKKGIISIANAMPDSPILPATHNSALFFGRNFISIKKPGTVTIKFMPAIKKLDTANDLFLKQLENIIETETTKLL